MYCISYSASLQSHMLNIACVSIPHSFVGTTLVRMSSKTATGLILQEVLSMQQ